MAFDPLATTGDLSARNIAVPSSMSADTLLAAASATVREAAGCPISMATSTVPLVADDNCVLDLPGVPVTAVASVLIEGVAADASTLVNGCWSAGWRLSGNRILFKQQRFETPATVTVTYTHGFTVVPEDIVDLVCALTAMAASGGDYGTVGRLDSYRIGDYSEKFVHPAGTESPSPLAIPDSVRNGLRARFGTSAVMVSVG